MSARADAVRRHITQFATEYKPFTFIACDGPNDLLGTVWVALKTWTEVWNECVLCDPEYANWLRSWAQSHDTPLFVIYSVHPLPEDPWVPPIVEIHSEQWNPATRLRQEDFAVEVGAAKHLASYGHELGIKIPLCVVWRTPNLFPTPARHRMGAMPVTMATFDRMCARPSATAIETFTVLSGAGYKISPVVQITLKRQPNKLSSMHHVEKALREDYVEENICLTVNVC